MTPEFTAVIVVILIGITLGGLAIYGRANNKQEE